jgi:hypothetical protein
MQPGSDRYHKRALKVAAAVSGMFDRFFVFVTGTNASGGLEVLLQE